MPIHTLNRLTAKVASKVSLQTVLIVPFVLQIVGTVGLVGYLSFKSGQEDVEDLAHQLMAQVGERVSDRLTTYLQAPQTAVTANHLAVEQGILNINDVKQLRQQLWQQLTLNPSLEGLYFSNEPGEEITYGRFQSEETVKQAEKLTGEDLSIGTPHTSILRSTDPGKRKYYLVDSKGNPRKLIFTFPIDNRTTTWYRTAKASKQQTWSPISVYKIVPSLGIFAVTPIYDQAGKWRGLFASSFTLSAISTFLDRLHFSPSGQIFIMERSGKLVATSMQETLLVKPEKGEPTQLLAVNSKDTRSRDIARQLTHKFGNFRTLQNTQQLSLVSNHKRQFVRVTPYRDKYGLDWLVVVVVPESDFMEQIHANTRTTSLLCLAALFGSISLGILTTRWITKPILRLNTTAKDIAKGEWDKTIEVNRADELGQLTNSFNQMAAQLQQSFAELNSLNTALAQSESRLNQIIEAIPVGVSVHDITGKIIYVNQSAKQLLSIETIPEAESEQLAEVYQVYRAGTEQLYPAENMPVVRSLQGERARVDDMEIRCPDHPLGGAKGNRTIPLEVYSTPLFDETGNVVAAIAAFFDITERKQAEQLLADYNRALEAQVIERTAELSLANELLKLEIAERKLLEGKLYSSTQQVRAIFDSITDIVLIIDAKNSLQIIPTKAIDWNIGGISLVNLIAEQFFQEDTEGSWFAPVQQVLETQQPVNFDYSLRISHQTVWLAARISPLTDESVAWIARDISDRKLVEKEIRQLSTALENAVEGISRLDTQGRYIAVNKAYANTVGYQPEEMIGKEWPPTVHPDDVENMIAAYQEMLSTGKVEAEARGIRKDGSIFYKQLVMVTAYDEQHNFIGHYCFMKDISDKKQAEETRQHQLAVIEAATNGIAILNRNSEYTYLNKAHVTLFGYTNANELIGKTWKELYYPEEINRFERDIFPILLQQGHWQGEATGKKQDGTTFAEEVSLTLTEGKELICVCQDITQRKRAEQALRESEQRYLAIIEDQTELIARFLPNGTLSFVNVAYCRYFGLAREELIGHHFAPVIIEEDREQVNQLVNSLSLENPVVTVENRVIVAGEVRWTQWINRGIFNEQGNLIKVQAVGRDITDKKLAELALQHQKEIFQTIFDNLPVLLCFYDADFQIQLVNSAFEQVLGWSLAELQAGVDIMAECYRDPEYRASVLEFMTRADGTWRDFQLRTRAGQIVETTWANVRLPNGSTVGIGQDITQRKRAELELQEREYRLRTLGDNLPSGVIYQLVHEPSGNYYFSYISAGIERLIGVKPEAVTQDASNLHNLIVEEDRLLCEQLTEQSRRNLSVFQMQMRKRKPSGEIQWSYLRSAPRRLEDGRTVWDGIETDITNFKKAEEALREKAQQEKAIATVIQRMRQTLDIDTIFRATTEELRGVIECDRVVVYQFNSDWSGEFVAESVAAGWVSLMQQQNNNSNATDKFLNDPRCTVKTTMLRSTPEPVADTYLQQTKGGAYNQGISYRVAEDIYQAGFSSCYIQLLEELQIRAYIIVPIYCGNQLWGLLASYQNSDSRAWSEAEIHTVVQIGIQLGIALQQAQLLQQTQQQAIQLQHAKEAAVSAAAQSAAANRAKSKFLANMSHELRTPLNGILGYAQILQADKNCTPKQQKGVGIIHQCGTHLLTLINDILDLSKIEAGKIELYPEDFHLPFLLTSLSEIFQLKATQKSITFTYLPLNQLPNVIHADEKRLRQVLMNLLSNAVKFTDRGSVTFQVEVIGNGGDLTPLTPLPYQGRGELNSPLLLGQGQGVGSAPNSPLLLGQGQGVGSAPNSPLLSGEGQGVGSAPNTPLLLGEGQGEGPAPNSPLLLGEGQGEESAPNTPLLLGEGQGVGFLPNNKIRFQIEDTGIGIPSEELEKIFLPFEQVGDISRRSEGTGLGLAITRKIVELMGSEIFVESTPGVGSKFGFDLDVPVVSTPMKSITLKSTDNIIGYSGEKRKILIVDDRWENRTVLINILEPIGFELEQAADGQEGLEKASEFQPDLILADLVMPIMDGYQMTRQLRQLPELQNTIIIAISANAFAVDRLQSLESGCNDFLPKPFKAEDLLEKIKTYLNLSWIYDSQGETKSQLKGNELSRSPQKLGTEMIIPPKEELLALYEAADSGFVSGVKGEAIRLQQLNPDYTPFATRILELAADFEYEEIVNLIDRYLSED